MLSIYKFFSQTINGIIIEPLYYWNNHPLNLGEPEFAHITGLNIEILISVFHREGTSRFGGDDSMVIQITPVYKVIQGKTIVLLLLPVVWPSGCLSGTLYYR